MYPTLLPEELPLPECHPPAQKGGAQNLETEPHKTKVEQEFG